MSPSIETERRNAEEACCDSPSAATWEYGLGGGSKERVTWAVRHPAGRASICRRTSPKKGSERVVKKERVTRWADRPAFSIARKVCSPVRAGLGSVITHKVDWYTNGLG